MKRRSHRELELDYLKTKRVLVALRTSLIAWMRRSASSPLSVNEVRLLLHDSQRRASAKDHND